MQKAVALEKTPSEAGDVDIKLGEEVRVSDFMTTGFVRAAADLGRLKKIRAPPLHPPQQGYGVDF